MIAGLNIWKKTGMSWNLIYPDLRRHCAHRPTHKDVKQNFPDEESNLVYELTTLTYLTNFRKK